MVLPLLDKLKRQPLILLAQIILQQYFHLIQHMELEAVEQAQVAQVALALVAEVLAELVMLQWLLLLVLDHQAVVVVNWQLAQLLATAVVQDLEDK